MEGKSSVGWGGDITEHVLNENRKRECWGQQGLNRDTGGEIRVYQNSGFMEKTYHLIS